MKKKRYKARMRLLMLEEQRLKNKGLSLTNDMMKNKIKWGK